MIGLLIALVSLGVMIIVVAWLLTRNQKNDETPVKNIITTNQHPNHKYKDCELEYFPKSGLWYAKYRGHFIFNGSNSYSLHSTPSCFCLSDKDKDNLIEKLDRYLETVGIGTTIIKL